MSRFPARRGAAPQSYQVDGVEVAVRRSERRRRTVSARREGSGLVVQLPAGMAADEERAWVEKMVHRVLAGERRRRAPARDDALAERAVALARRHLDGVVGHPVRAAEIRWVDNQNHRWGSCTPATGVIRLSSRLRPMPSWVVDHVLLHELVHLVEPTHNRRFAELVALDPQAERARGFLEGWQAALLAGEPGQQASEPDGAPDPSGGLGARPADDAGMID